MGAPGDADRTEPLVAAVRKALDGSTPLALRGGAVRQETYQLLRTGVTEPDDSRLPHSALFSLGMIREFG